MKENRWIPLDDVEVRLVKGELLRLYFSVAGGMRKTCCKFFATPEASRVVFQLVLRENYLSHFKTSLRRAMPYFTQPRANFFSGIFCGQSMDRHEIDSNISRGLYICKTTWGRRGFCTGLYQNTLQAGPIKISSLLSLCLCVLLYFYILRRMPINIDEDLLLIATFDPLEEKKSKLEPNFLDWIDQVVHDEMAHDEMAHDEMAHDRVVHDRLPTSSPQGLYAVMG